MIWLKQSRTEGITSRVGFSAWGTKGLQPMACFVAVIETALNPNPYNKYQQAQRWTI